ncbi:MAG: hypothetical protein LAC70_05425 [Methylovulum sp.]|nr:hypothetical protein [Methylovulum sp.]
MAKTRKIKVKIKVKKDDLEAPGPIALICACVMAYWLSGIINPGFVAIAFMIFLFFPVFFADFLFPEAPIQTEPVEEKNEEDDKEDVVDDEENKEDSLDNVEGENKEG